jgi:hypothetical protein
MMPTIPITILDHRVWVYVDTGATFSVLRMDEAYRIGIDWEKGRQQMIVVGDGSFIPTYFHDLSIQIGEWQVTAPIGFSERLGVGFNLLGRTGIFNQFIDSQVECRFFEMAFIPMKSKFRNPNSKIEMPPESKTAQHEIHLFHPIFLDTQA